MEVTREEMLELAKYETYHLDDRLCPMSREDLRAESWLQGYEFARRHQPKERKGLMEKFNEEYENFVKQTWYNSTDKTPEEGEKVCIRILTTDKQYDIHVATFKTNEPTGEQAFFWNTGFCKVSSCVLWRRLTEEEK